MSDDLTIPARLNMMIAALQLTLLTVILWATGQVPSWPAVFGLALAYGIVMNSAYAMLHEAEHGILHPDRRINDAVGALLALYFPAPFHLIRQGHIGHHLRNRSDDEAFDYYFDPRDRGFKYIQLYGTLTGLYWVMILVALPVALFNPLIVPARSARFNRTTEAFLESLNPKFRGLIRLEAAACLLLHGGLMFAWRIPPGRYFAVLFGFGFLWSAMQYAHHYGTSRDVQAGAANLKTLGALDRVWLNHNWHLNHHRQPTVPWLHLPALSPQGERRGSLVRAYLRMWRGPAFTSEHVENRNAGRIIR